MSPQPYGLLAEFATADALLLAVRRARENGCRQVDAYTPFHVEGLSEELGFRSLVVQTWTVIGALAGGIGTYLLQW
ncbi:MAG TPA: quinol:electron acceptor oxidoreductase subunit ActD, partial [Ramlibacter sp.]